jgi:hypothetical protein
MGLDTYAARTPVDFFDPDLDEGSVDERFGCTDEDIAAFQRAQEECERWDRSCLFGGNYFRGKLYSYLLEHITGQSLYQPWIPADVVRKMSEALDDCDPAEAIRSYRETAPPYTDLDVTVVRQLRQFFRVCAGRGLGLVGSW